jgi:hypothetical protein
VFERNVNEDCLRAQGAHRLRLCCHRKVRRKPVTTIIVEANEARLRRCSALRRVKNLFAIHEPASGRCQRRPLIEPLEDRTLLASASILDIPPTIPAQTPGTLPLAIPLVGGTASPVGLTPAQIQHAYGFNTIEFGGTIQGDGTGQTIAIVDPYSDSALVPSGASGFSTSDLAQFDKQFALPDPTFTIVRPDGTPQQAPPPNAQGSGWGQETALDVEWAHALAPGAAIMLVEVPGGSTSQIDKALIAGVQYARKQAAVSVVSMSWTENTITSDGTFTTPAGHQGITFVAGSGDYGSPPSYPATSPNVLGVGGTYFPRALDQEGDYSVESAWAGSGGGVDPGEIEPKIQLPVAGAVGGRAVPDVAFDAGSAVAVYDSYDYKSKPWVALSGTSIGAPAWSALLAIADQGRVMSGQPTLDGPTQTIPDVYSIYQSNYYSTAFHDITTGGNNANQANVGYDQVTGLGTPRATTIAMALSGEISAPALIAPAQNAVVTTPTPTFQWSPIVGSSAYILTVTDTTTGTKVVSYTAPALSNNGPATSYTPPIPLNGGDAYSWNVGAVTALGNVVVTSAGAQTFVIIPVPTPTGPSGAVDLTTPTLQWSPVPGAAGYAVSLSDVTTGQKVVTGLMVNSPSYVPSAPLHNLDTYLWTVSALSSVTVNGSPYASPPSGSVVFTVNVDVAPVPIAPPNEASVPTKTPELQWSPVAGAASYRVTLVDLSTFPYTPSVASTLNTYFVPSAPLAGTYYQWSVQAFLSVDGATTPTPASELSYFTISQTAEPVLLSPQPGAVVTTTSPTFRWSFSGGIGLAFSLFDVTEDETVLPYLGVFGTSYTLGVPLDNGHTYEWSIASTSPGPSATFTVVAPDGGNETLPAPTLTSPSGIINSTQPLFQWAKVPGAVDYAFSINADSPPVLVHGTSYQLTSASSPTGLPTGFSYEWSVTAYDASGNYSPPSVGMDFFVQAPGSTQLAAPTDLLPAGTVTTYTPDLSWSAVPGANSYTLYLYDETAGFAVLNGVGAGNQTSYPIEFGQDNPPLVNGHDYQWYVYSLYSNGDASEVGAVASQTFSVSGPAISSPVQSAPAAGASVNSTTPQFQWSAVAGATGYLFFLTDPTSGSAAEAPGVSVTGTTYTPTHPLVNGRTYQWQVSALITNDDGTVYGPESAPSEFVVSVPGTATLDAHDDSGTLTTATPTLQWSPVPGAAGYELYLEDTNSSTQVLDGFPLITTSYTISAPLNNGDSYEWYVQAYDDFGNIGSAPTALVFSISAPTVSVPTPEPTGPIGQVKGATPTLQWSPVANAVGYSLYITDTTTGQPIPGSPVQVPAGSGNGDLSYPLPNTLPTGDRYSFYVRAVYADDMLGPPGQSDDFSVSTGSDLAGPPTPESPKGFTSATQPPFKWSKVTNAMGYYIEIEDTTTTTINYVLKQAAVSGTTFYPTQALIPGHSYTWQVAAYDSSGQETTWSSPTTFRVPLPPPSPTGPSGTTKTIEPVLEWSPVTGATGYEIEVMQTSGATSTVVVPPTNVSGTSYPLNTPLTRGQSYQWRVAAIDGTGVQSAWSNPQAFSIASNATLPPAPTVIRLAGVTRTRRRISTITIVFNEALQPASAASRAFYEVEQRTSSGRTIVYGQPIGVRSASYRGSNEVTVRLVKPLLGPIRLIILPGIIAANGAASAKKFAETVD